MKAFPLNFLVGGWGGGGGGVLGGRNPGGGGGGGGGRFWGEKPSGLHKILVCRGSLHGEIG